MEPGIRSKIVQYAEGTQLDKIIVRGGHKLHGTVRAHGAKNAVLPILAATILCKRGENVLYEIPPLQDVSTIIRVLETLGITTERVGDALHIDARHLTMTEAPYEYVRKMRASFLVMGPLLARVGKARIPLPGGCAIGSRPIDLHLKGFQAMGATIDMENGCIEARINGRLQGAKIYLDIASVGATENIMMAATLAEGTTIIENAAQEPEIVDLANFLNSMGASIVGAGTSEIRIEGVAELQATRHYVISDRIEVGTFMVAAAITRGDVTILNAIPDHLRSITAKLREMGVGVEQGEDSIRVYAKDPLKPVDVKTMPYPGFPTDMQAQMMALLLTVNGSSVISETVFENRFMHCEEFKRMNAKIKIDGRTALVEGGDHLSGAKVCATDLRAAAALVLLGLAADGETEVTGLEHLDRGYVHFVEKLQQLGADICRIQEREVIQEEEDELLYAAAAGIPPLIRLVHE